MPKGTPLNEAMFSGTFELPQCFLAELGSKHSASESSSSASLLLAIGADLEELAPKNERISIL